MHLSNKHETRKMYFENKGAVQVLLGPQRKSWTATHSEAREPPGRLAEEGSGLAWEANCRWVGWGAQRENSTGKASKGSGRVESGRNRLQSGTDLTTRHLSEEVILAPWALEAGGPRSSDHHHPTKVRPQCALEGPVSHN